MFDHVEQKLPTGDVNRYADDVYQSIVDAFRDELTANIVPETDESVLEETGYTKLKSESVPAEVNRLHAEKSATYWQKEIWKVDGVDATTGFARMWCVSDDQLGVLQPSAGDFDTDHATRRMKAELRGDDPT